MPTTRNPQPIRSFLGLAKRRGVALIFVLAMLVLLLAVVLAFFSQAASLRTTRATMTASTTSAFLTDVAVNTILNDFKLEVEAGSDLVVVGGKTVAYRPLLTDKPSGTDNQNFTSAPSMVPQESGVDRAALPNVVKISRGNASFFPMGTGNASGNGFQPDVEGPSRATAISTNATSRNGRFIPSGANNTFWNKPGLMTANDTVSFESPDWIYLDRSGYTPTTFTDNSSSRAIDNDERVVGRFAYVVYDVGGLLDVNVAGNGFTSNNSTIGPDNSRRGRLHQVDPTGIIPGISNFNQIANWRWGSNLTVPDGNRTAFLSNPKADFSAIPSGNQGLVGRQDLLNALENFGTGPHTEAPPYLTTFTRAVDAPHWRPDPDRPRSEPYADEPTALDPDEDDLFNPDVVGARFASPGNLTRGSDPDLIVPAGTPVMPRRFPLSKIDLLSEEIPDEESIDYYFGLVRSLEPDGSWNGAWEYDPDKLADDGRLRRLEDVASQGREPNFFEVLQAGILSGSLGKYSGTTRTPDNSSAFLAEAAAGYFTSHTFDAPRDSKRWLQIFQIGANIIDQWDSDSAPTTVRHPDHEPEFPLEVYGTEAIPYIHQLGLVPYRPLYGSDMTYSDYMQLWMVFSVWNPHQNEVDPDNQATEYRIRPLSGTWVEVALTYMVGNGNTTASPFDASAAPFGGLADSRPDRIVDLNPLVSGSVNPPVPVRSLTFNATENYSEVAPIGNLTPSSLSDTPGVLIWQEDLGDPSNSIDPNFRSAAVPPLGQRRASLQDRINNATNDAIQPWTQPGTRIPNYTVAGEWEFTKTGPVNPTPEELEWWEYRDDGTRYFIRGRYSVKAHNVFRQLNPIGHMRGMEFIDSAPSFVLEGNFNGTWKRIQRVDQFFRRLPGSGGINHNRFYRNQITTGAQDYFSQNTHHSVMTSGEIETLNTLSAGTYGLNQPGSFYKWSANPNRAHRTYTKPDPRTQRFGMYETAGTYFPAGDVFGKPLTLSPTGGWASGANPSTPQQSFLRFGALPESQRRFELYAPSWATSQRSPLGFITNNPDVSSPNEFHTVIYEDMDRVIRPADGYYGGNATVRPVVPGEVEGRPLILNRPFVSTAELGYVFRDQPWKTLDFFSRFSADTGLLDLFSVDESDGETPIVAGKVNLNTRRPEVLEAVLTGTAQRVKGIREGVTSSPLADTTSAAVAEQIIAESEPVSYSGDLVPRVLGKSLPGDLNDPLAGIMQKDQREAAIRSLAGVGQTRTWNLMIDLVVQSGSFSPGSSAAQFMVSAQKRCWIHVALDRITGEVVDIQREWVDE